MRYLDVTWQNRWGERRIAIDSTRYDIAVLGGGPGGYVAAIRAAQLGMRAVVIEREALGGICLNWGCIPTKSLLRSAEVLEMLREAEAFGLSSGEVGFDTKAVVARSRKAASKLSAGVTFLLKKNNVDVLFGEGRILGVGSLEVREQEGQGEEQGEKGRGDSKGGRRIIIQADHIIVATGASPRVLSGVEIDGEFVWGYREAMAASRFPKRMVIAGGGAIGIEFAYFYAVFGVEVILVEGEGRILPSEDREVSAFLQSSLEGKGIEFRLGVRIVGIERRKGGGGGIVHFSDGTKEDCEVILSALGVVGNVGGIGLEDLGVGVEGGSIRVDSLGRTGVGGIYAIGDVVGSPMLAHKASREGVVCVEAISGDGDVRGVERLHIPSCVYCRPQVASVGMGIEVAEGLGIGVRVGRFPLSANGKAVSVGEEGGFVKVIFDKETGAFLGAQMVGSEVTEQVQGFSLALQMEATEAELMGSIFPHPTISEAMQEAVLAAFGRAVHIP